jgi:hypothetical protein
VRIPLFERWINIHLEAPAPLRRARKQAQLRWLVLGGTLAVLLFIAYFTWLRSTRTPEPATLGDCAFELDHPDRVGADETIVLNVYQECEAPGRHALAIEPVRSSLTFPAPTTNCTESPRSCTTTFTCRAGPTAHDEYIVRLRVDDQPLVSASIKKDGFASVRAFGEKTVPVLAIITALLTALGAFHKELWRSAAQLIGRGGEPPATPPGAPQT